MQTVQLTPVDLAVGALLVLVDVALSLRLRLGLHRRILVAAARMTVQLLAVGYLLRLVFALRNPAATLAILTVMVLLAAREAATRPERRLAGFAGYAIGGIGVALPTTLTVVLALTTAIRPEPWYDPRYALPLVGIVLGSVLNAVSLALDASLDGFVAQRAAIEARLALGDSFATATRPLVIGAARRGMVPILNQMAACGIITLPGLMTGQILAGMDPLEAVKYQILLMFLITGACGLAAVTSAMLAAFRVTDERQRLRLDRLR